MTKRIVYTNSEGGVSVVIPAPGFTAEQCMSAVPADATDVEVVAVEDVPADRTFRNAWKRDVTPAPEKIAVDINTAKNIVHARRRDARAKEFAPLDIEVTIPGKAGKAELKRSQVRTKYENIQLEVDAAVTVDELKAVLVREGL